MLQTMPFVADGACQVSRSFDSDLISHANISHSVRPNSISGRAGPVNRGHAIETANGQLRSIEI